MTYYTLVKHAKLGVNQNKISNDNTSMPNSVLLNKIYLVNFPKKIDIENNVHKHYKLYYSELPLSDQILTSAQLIIIFKDRPDLGEIITAKNTAFYREIIYFNQEQLIKFQVNPLRLLDEMIGRDRVINPRQFEILAGSIVRSLADPRIGFGVVVDKKEDFYTVNFPKAKGYYKSELVKCHKSHLRVVSHIQEVKNEK